MRWLGVYFDLRLSFVHYASKMATKGRQAAAGLTMLGNRTRGVDPSIMRKAVHSCILPIFTYKSPVWWSGRLQKDKEGRDIKNGKEKYCKKLDKSKSVALRAISPI